MNVKVEDNNTQESDENTPENLQLLEEISDWELESLQCPTYEAQTAAWQTIVENVSRERVEFLLLALGYDLVDWRLHDKSTGVINRIYFLDVRQQANSCTKDEKKELSSESHVVEERLVDVLESFVLRICNPHKFWERGRCESEVAVLKYVKEHTAIPVPKIHSYSFDKSTSLLGCEYILMDRVPGVILGSLFSWLLLKILTICRHFKFNITLKRIQVTKITRI